MTTDALRQRGFILSIEAVLLFTILGIGLLVGVAVLRDALFKLYLSREDTRFLVADSSDPPRLVGRAVGFDEYDAPLLVFVDYHDASDNSLPGGFNFRTLIGVRPDRLTSRQPAFYRESDCTGTPVCLARPGDREAHAVVVRDTGDTSITVGELAGTASTLSFLHPLQGTDDPFPSSASAAPAPGYAVARDHESNDLLFRSTEQTCDEDLGSMYVSQSLAPTDGACKNFDLHVTDDDLTSFRQAEAVKLPSESDNVLSRLQPPYRLNMVGNPRTEFTRLQPVGEGIDGVPRD